MYPHDAQGEDCCREKQLPGPTRFDRAVMRGDTLFYKDQVFQDTMTGRVFTVPVTNPITPPPPGAAPYNLAGCTLQVTVKYQYPDADSQAVYLLTSNPGGGVTVTSAGSGQYTVFGAPQNTASQADERVALRIDTQLFDAGGNVFTVEYGELAVKPDVTRAVLAPPALPPGQGGLVSTFDAPSLAVLGTVNDTLANDATLAYVVDPAVRAYYRLDKLSTAPVDGWNVLATLSGAGRWVRTDLLPGSAAYNAAWYALTDVYWDPVHGADANSGATALAPVQNFAEIVRRYGAIDPRLAHNLTIHQLTSQAPGVDPVVFRPILLPGAFCAIIGTPTAVATFNLGAVTAKNRGTPQTLTAAGFTAAGLAANQQVVNATRGGSKAWIQALASGTATLSQPVTPLTVANGSNFPASVGSEVDTWTAGDSVTVYAMPTINLVVFDARGGQVNASLQGGIWWLQNVHVVDPAGAPGSSFFAVQAIDAVPWYVDCVFDPYVDLVGVDANGVDGAFAVNCVWNGSGQIQCGTFAAGIANLFNIIVGYFGCIDLDALCMAPGGALACPDDSAFIGAVYIASSMTAYGNGAAKIDPVWLGSSFIWGPGGIQIIDNATVQNKTGTTWVATLLCKGGLNINGNVTATKYVPGTPGVWTDEVSITPANLDAFDGLQNPRTGAKFLGAA